MPRPIPGLEALNLNRFSDDIEEDIRRKQAGRRNLFMNSELEATMSSKRNLLMVAAYVGALVFISLPFTQIETKGPPATLAGIEALQHQ